MTDTTAPITFEPDWEKILDVALNHPATTWETDVRRAISEYQRRMAEAGYVVVRRDDAQGAMAVLLGVANSDETNAASAHRIMMSLHAAIHPTSPTI